MDDAIRAVVTEVVPDRTVASVDEPADAGRPGNRTVRLRFLEGTPLFLKLRTDGDADRNRRETAAMRYADDHCSIRVPTVVASDSTFEPPYLVTAPLSGTPASADWTTGASRLAIATDIGRAIAGVTAAGFSDHGRIVGGDRTRLERETGPWSMVLAESIERGSTEAPIDRIADAPERVVELVRRKAPILDGAPATLLYPDCRPGNVFRDGRVGLIDWEWTLVGDPGVGLCWGEYWVADRADVADGDREQLRRAVRDGYRERAGALPEGVEGRRDVYRLVTFLQAATTFRIWEPTVPEPTAELADWVVEEFRDRLETAEGA